MNKNTKLYNSITNISDEFIEEAQQHPNANKNVKRYSWVKWGAAAACLCLAVCAAAIPWEEQPTDEPTAKQYTMSSTLPAESSSNQMSGQQQTPKSLVSDSVQNIYKQSGATQNNHKLARSSVIYGKALTAAGAGGILPGGALLQMPIGSDNNQQESNQPALTDKPLIHAKQIAAAPMVYVNDTLYQNYAALKSVDNIQNKFVYLGDVQSYTRNGAADPVPNQNFQANTPFVGTPINQYGDDVIIYMEVEDEYWLYKAVNTVDTNEKEHPINTEEANPSKTITTDDENIKY